MDFYSFDNNCRMNIRENISLKGLNTFGIEAKARYFVEVNSENELLQLLQHPIFKQQKHLILGGGSNILFTRDFDGLVMRCCLTGIERQNETREHILLNAGSGENWHQLVLHCLQNDWGGVENLSLIPGTTGAAPMQNIGAYGVEIQNVIENVTGVELATGQRLTFTNEECRFSYRESIFKQELKEKFFISSVTLRLTIGKHKINTTYGAIQDVLRQQNIMHPSIQDVSRTVIAIRESKLPDPRLIGNAGSFFKNPTVSQLKADELQKAFPEIPLYPADNQNVKVAAGWLIEQCGWKGKRNGNVGVHPRQALVLVNYGEGKGEEIYQLALRIKQSVDERFGISLITEVNIV
jgi:UDP-N-acetylmuramate dehydrogenase